MRGFGRDATCATLALGFAVVVATGLAGARAPYPEHSFQRSDQDLKRLVQRPTVLSTTVDSRSLPATGGLTHFTVRVKDANECRISTAGASVVGMSFAREWSVCSSGIFRRAVRLGANDGPSAVEVAFRLDERHGSISAWYPLGSVTIAGTPARSEPPLSPAASLSISTNTLPGDGGAFTLTYSSSNASDCTLSSTPDLWSGSDPASVSCNGSYSATIGSSTDEQQWTFAFTATSSSGQSVTSSQTLDELPASTAFSQSRNWSGYIVPSGGALTTEVSASWAVPVMDCAATPRAGSSSWVGIGGAGSESDELLQTGIDANCVHGDAQYDAWWEQYSEVSSMTFGNFPVSAGDSIQASVFEITSDCTTLCGQWETVLEDLTTGLAAVMVTQDEYGVESIGLPDTLSDQGSTSDVTFGGGYTGEWIVEDYEDGDSLVPFADYGTVTFTDLGLDGTSPWTLSADEGVEMVQDGDVLSTPAVPGTDGFSISYTGPLSLPPG